MNKYLVCAWCNADIKERTFSVGLRMLPSLDLSESAGSFIPFPLSGADKMTQAYVTKENSAAKKAGFDLVLITCCESCRDDLKSALHKEKQAAAFMGMN